MQGFPKESLDSEDTKFVEEGIINNYDSISHSERHQKLLTRGTKAGNTTFTKLKTAIKLGDLTLAYKTFEEDLLKKFAI